MRAIRHKGMRIWFGRWYSVAGERKSARNRWKLPVHAGFPEQSLRLMLQALCVSARIVLELCIASLDLGIHDRRDG